MMAKMLQRMGSGHIIEMTESEMRKDIEEGTKDAAERCGASPLTEDEMKRLFDIYSSPRRFVGVEEGNEVILSYDAGTVKLNAGSGGRAGLDIGRRLCTEIYERVLGADTMDFGHVDYSFKPIKNILADEQEDMEQTLLATTIPIYYGAMPNLGSYTQPDGPFPNPTELLTEGKIEEAKAACEEIVEPATRDMVYIASGMYEAGADGVNFDTTGAFGDADFLAALRASEILRKKYPNIFIEMGMAGEFILGIHGELTYDGVRLAGLYSHEQVKLAEKAGVNIFGPVVNINTHRSCAWNMARVLTFVKPCVENAEIPVHPNMGMGVGGSPL
ncbi:MAG: [dimethylamine--corrinoid protein] Co-methyltransferase, partial [Desulfobacterales bacterium]|nr:[dimethylamine--corrinoid protein] Co-methyltransferase [Desulfobacterales bacterium]